MSADIMGTGVSELGVSCCVAGCAIFSAVIIAISAAFYTTDYILFNGVTFPLENEEKNIFYMTSVFS